MSVQSAGFSPKTASAIKTAVEMEILPVEALTTAHFIQLIYDWFSLMTSKVRKTSITKRNCDQKYIFLHTIIELFQRIQIESDWKPLNKGYILCTLSFCDVVEFLFSKDFDFMLGHRFTADATENVVSQIRKKFGALPSALDTIRAIRLISVAQFVSDISRNSYMSNSDEYLLNFCKEKKVTNSVLSFPCSQISEVTISPHSDALSMMEVKMQTYTLDDFEVIMNMYNVNGTIAESTTRAVEKHVCSTCVEFISAKNLPDSNFVSKAQIYTSKANQGSLKKPCLETLCLLLNCGYYFDLCKKRILKDGNEILMSRLLEEIDVDFPICCDLKKKLIKHFFTVRSFCLKNFYENNKKRKIVHGTASAKK